MTDAMQTEGGKPDGQTKTRRRVMRKAGDMTLSSEQWYRVVAKMKRMRDRDQFEAGDTPQTIAEYIRDDEGFPFAVNAEIVAEALRLARITLPGGGK